MKKLLFSLFVLSFIGMSAQSFGLKAGFNFANISDVYSDESTSSKMGFHAGVFSNIPVAERFMVQPELLYNQKGMEYDDRAIKLDYISLPVMFHYDVAQGFYLEAGPEFSYLVSAVDKNRTGSDSSTEVDIKEDLNSFDVGVGVGLGVDFAYSYTLFARYVFGVSSIINDDVASNDAKNSVFQLGFAYTFGR